MRTFLVLMLLFTVVGCGCNCGCSRESSSTSYSMSVPSGIDTEIQQLAETGLSVSEMRRYCRSQLSTLSDTSYGEALEGKNRTISTYEYLLTSEGTKRYRDYVKGRFPHLND